VTVRRAFFRSPTAVIGLLLLLLVVVFAIVGPIIMGAKAAELNASAINQAPSWQHLLGTDSLGRDIFARLVAATRTTIVVSVAAAAIGAVIGIPLGLCAVVLPRLLRTILLRFIDSLIAFPGLLIAIFVGAVLGPSATSAGLGVGIALSFSFARVSSALALSIAGRDYMAAARILGISWRRRIFRHVLPNAGETLVITTTVSISSSIVAVSSLSFLGLGIQPPSFDWGSMLTVGVGAFYTNAAGALGPAAAIAVSALAFGLVGEALARAMNPLLWEELRPVVLAAPIGFRSRFQRRRTPARPEPAQQQQAQPDTVLDVRDLVVEFPRASGTVAMVNRVSFAVRRGERIGIVGESGSGKTMTALAISQLVPYPGEVGGQIELCGQEIAYVRHADLPAFLGRSIGIAFQDPASSLNPALRIQTQLTESARANQHADRRGAQAVALQRLDEVRLPAPADQMRKHPHELSGGMRQRVMLAISLMNQPAVLLADEPTTALDVTVQAQIMELLADINSVHRTAIVLISHNIALVSQNCDRVLVMYAGRIVEDISVQDLIAGPRHPYTRGLLASLPDLRQPKDEALVQIDGSAPDMADLPPGCPFSPRCPLAIARCQEEPPLIELSGGGRVACWVTTAATTAS
jgi:oligopeptide/dipeptide ABC transporter ATP-binding protein